MALWLTSSFPTWWLQHPTVLFKIQKSGHEPSLENNYVLLYNGPFFFISRALRSPHEAGSTSLVFFCPVFRSNLAGSGLGRRPVMSISTGHTLGPSGALSQTRGSSLSLNTSSREQPLLARHIPDISQVLSKGSACVKCECMNRVQAVGKNWDFVLFHTCQIKISASKMYAMNSFTAMLQCNTNILK